MNIRYAVWGLFGLSVAAGCARDRDFAVVEPTLSRQYQTTPAMLAAQPPTRVMGIQQVAGQTGVVQPVYQAQGATPPAVAPPVGAAAIPPTSSTAGIATPDPNGQPYYAPPPINGAQGAPSAMPFPAPVATGVQSPVVTSNPTVGAGVYPVASGAMWAPTNGNQQIAVHQFSTPTTGSSFIPSVPMDGGTASSMQSSEGVIPASATMPWASSLQPNAPPPQNTRSPFLSDTGEHTQPSRLGPGSATPLEKPAARPPAIQLDERPQTKVPDPSLAEQNESPSGRRTKGPIPPPVDPGEDETGGRKDATKPGNPQDAPSANPSRTNPTKSPPTKEPLAKEPPFKEQSPSPPPKKVEMPLDDKKGGDLNEPAAPKKSAAPPTKKQTKDVAPGKDFDDDLPLPPKTGSGS